MEPIIVQKHPDPRLTAPAIWQVLTPLENYICGGTKWEAEVYASKRWEERRSEFLDRYEEEWGGTHALDFIKYKADELRRTHSPTPRKRVGEGV